VSECGYTYTYVCAYAYAYAYACACACGVNAHYTTSYTNPTAHTTSHHTTYFFLPLIRLIASSSAATHVVGTNKHRQHFPLLHERSRPKRLTVDFFSQRVNLSNHIFNLSTGDGTAEAVTVCVCVCVNENYKETHAHTTHNMYIQCVCVLLILLHYTHPHIHTCASYYTPTHYTHPHLHSPCASGWSCRGHTHTHTHTYSTLYSTTPHLVCYTLHTPLHLMRLTCILCATGWSCRGSQAPDPGCSAGSSWLGTMSRCLYVCVCVCVSVCVCVCVCYVDEEDIILHFAFTRTCK
jgi:hypothetical protein